MGFIGNELHIQVLYDDIATTDNHGWLQLIEKNTGETVNCGASVSWFAEDKVSSYEEYIFDGIAVTELENYDLYGEFITCNNLTKGNWQVSFKVENTEDMINKN